MYVGAPGAFDRVGSVVRYPGADDNDFDHTSYDYLSNETLQEFFNPHNLTDFTDSYLGMYGTFLSNAAVALYATAVNLKILAVAVKKSQWSI